jgi:hypothetical protein
MTTSPRPARGEHGSVLILALCMLVVVGIVAFAGLRYADTSLRATSRTIRPEREATYAADGAADAALQYVVRDSAAGRDDGAPSCGDVAAFHLLVSLPAVEYQPPVEAWCRPESGSGLASADRVVTIESRIDGVPRLQTRARLFAAGEPPTYEYWSEL